MSTFESTHEFTIEPAVGSARGLSSSSTYTLVLTGDVDIAVQDRLDAELDLYSASEVPDVLIDLGGVTFLDSTGLSFLARVRLVSESRGGAVRLTRPAPDIRRLLELVGFDTVFLVDQDHRGEQVSLSGDESLPADG